MSKCRGEPVDGPFVCILKKSRIGSFVQISGSSPFQPFVFCVIYPVPMERNADYDVFGWWVFVHPRRPLKGAFRQG